jgi:hypothetical protein
MKDLYHDLYPEVALNFATYTAAQNGQSIIDLQGYNGALIVIMAGTVTDGSAYPFELKEGDESNMSDAAAVADADLINTEPTLDSDDDDSVHTFAYIGSKRYLRVDLKTPTGASSGGDFGALIIKGYPRHAPAMS